MNIVLFGTIFMDIKGLSTNHYDPVGRNVGEVKFIHGGVGRNVAENLGILNVPVTFASTVDTSSIGEAIVVRLAERKINTAYLKKVAAGGIGMWMAILDNNGDLAGSISKMPELAVFEELVDQQGEEMIAAATHVVLELDLSEAITRKVMRIAKRLNKPVYGIPGNLEVTRKCKDLLADMKCFICNDIEAEKIFPAYLEQGDVDLMKSELKKFADKLQMKSMVVTMGERGSVYYEQGEAIGYAPVQPVKMLDSTGAGDAFFSGVVAGLVQGKTMREAVEYGSLVAAYTIQSAESTCIGFVPQA